MPPSLSFGPRVALFADTFYEANGVATLSRQLACFACHRSLPFLLMRGGRNTGYSRDGSLQTVELKRSAAAFPLDKDLYCDPLLMRHRQFALDHLRAFKPDLVHITGPGDLGFLGLWAAHALRVPLVASWHTNLHQYLSRRLDRSLSLVPKAARGGFSRLVEGLSLRGLLTFYRRARFVLAPNQPLVELLHAGTGKPAYLMPHGVDLASYTPAAQQREGSGPFCIGYVGRLTTEKNVRSLVDLDHKLRAAGERNYKFLIVGEGGQRQWLERRLSEAEFTGVLRDRDLAAAYLRMDALVFPSRTDTFGLVVLEAMACGVPAVLAAQTGRNMGIQDGVSGLLSEDFSASLRRLMRDPSLRLALSSGARKIAKSHSWGAAFEGLYRIYAQELCMTKLDFQDEVTAG